MFSLCFYQICGSFLFFFYSVMCPEWAGSIFVGVGSWDRSEHALPCHPLLCLMVSLSLSLRSAGRSSWKILNRERSAVLWVWSPRWGPAWRLWWSQTQGGLHSCGPTSRKGSGASPSACGPTSTWCWRWTLAPIRSMGKCWGRTTAREFPSTLLSMLLLKVGTCTWQHQHWFIQLLIGFSY